MNSLTSTPQLKLVDTPRQPGSEAFQEAALQGVLKIPHCSHCERAHWYPRPLCPRCLSDKIEWKTASGLGEVYSFTIMRRAKPPYAIAYVTLDEGPVMMTNVVNCDLERIQVGMRVKVVFQADGSGSLVPLFEPMG